MVTWLKRFWTDEAFFTASVKTLISMAGALVFSGIIPISEWRYGAIVMALAHLIPAGQRPLSVSAAKLTDAEKEVTVLNLGTRAGAPDAVAPPITTKEGGK
jgi:hypothetical protein